MSFIPPVMRSWGLGLKLQLGRKLFLSFHSSMWSQGDHVALGSSCCRKHSVLLEPLGLKYWFHRMQIKHLLSRKWLHSSQLSVAEFLQELFLESPLSLIQPSPFSASFHHGKMHTFFAGSCTVTKQSYLGSSDICGKEEHISSLDLCHENFCSTLFNFYHLKKVACFPVSVRVWPRA